MALDLIFGKTKRDWSIGRPSRESTTRGLQHLAPAPTSDEVSLRLTPPEMAMLAEIAATKQRADAGARHAKKVSGLQSKAKRGDVAAQRSLRVLRESGALMSVTAMTMGSDTIPNAVYRAAVLKQAAKSASGTRPTTKHFFAAKAAVDKVMGKAGISLYLPGAKPGRITY